MNEYYDLFCYIDKEFKISMTDTELQDIYYAIEIDNLDEHLLNAHSINATDDELDAMMMLF